MRKWTYWLLIGAVIYMILQDPSDTGDVFQAFFSLLGDAFQSFFEFLDALFDGGTDGIDIRSPVSPEPVDPSFTPSG